MKPRPVFVVDFDGTLIHDNHYPEMGEWLPGAVEALHELLRHGEVLIYTMRVSPYERYHDGDENYRRNHDDIDHQLLSILDMLDSEGLHRVQVHTTKGKPAGTYYIDNQAIEFTGDWGEILSRTLGERENEGTTARHPSQDAGCCPEHRGSDLPSGASIIADSPRSPSVRGLDRVLAGSGVRVDNSREDHAASPGATVPDPASASPIREFLTGATRDTAEGKLAYEGFFSPLVLQERAKFMHKHRTQSDGSLRPADNWQKGIPLDAYMDSGFRHFMAWWLNHRGQEGGESLTESLCALMFNCEGYLHTLLTQ